MEKLAARCLAWVLFLTMASSVPLFGETTLRVATDDWPPYEYAGKDGDATGFSTEVVRAVAREMGVSVGKIPVMPWARCEAMLGQGDLDLIFSASPSDKRKEFSYFPDESLVDSPNLLFIRNDSEQRLKFDTLDDLKGKNIGVVRNYSYTTEFLDYVKQHSKVATALDDEQSFKALMNKRVDYIPLDLGNGLALIRKYGMEGKIIPLTNNPIKKDGLYVMFGKRTVKPDFVKQFSEALKAFKQTEAYKKIHDQHFSTQASAGS